MLEPAPGRLSMRMVWPNSRPSGSARVRARKSAEPPGGKPMTRRMGRARGPDAGRGGGLGAGAGRGGRRAGAASRWAAAHAVGRPLAGYPGSLPGSSAWGQGEGPGVGRRGRTCMPRGSCNYSAADARAFGGWHGKTVLYRNNLFSTPQAWSMRESAGGSRRPVPLQLERSPHGIPHLARRKMISLRPPSRRRAAAAAQDAYRQARGGRRPAGRCWHLLRAILVVGLATAAFGWLLT